MINNRIKTLELGFVLVDNHRKKVFPVLKGPILRMRHEPMSSSFIDQDATNELFRALMFASYSIQYTSVNNTTPSF